MRQLFLIGAFGIVALLAFNLAVSVWPAQVKVRANRAERRRGGR
jgi:hypothetical protein